MNKVKDYILKHYIEFIVLAVYIVIYFIVCAYHEPMYDEAQSYLIARDGSLLDILTKIPHYEGHPPLWHLIIAIFAKSGLGFEASLRIPGAILNITLAYMLIFKAPFNKYVRFILPFTYYLFFRFGVIVRPYVLTCTVLIFMAYYYKSKRNKPIRFMILILLLCLSTAYGMCIACGICMIWAYEIIIDIIRRKRNVTIQAIQTFNQNLAEGGITDCITAPSSDNNSLSGESDFNSTSEQYDKELPEECKKESSKNSSEGQKESTCKSKEESKSSLILEISSLSFILLFNIGLAYLISPKADTNSVVSTGLVPFIKGLVYMLIIAPADSMFIDAGLDGRLQDYAARLVSLSAYSIINLILGALTVAVLVYVAKKCGKLKELIIPYVFFSIFSAYVYFWYHHIGIVFGYILFVMWICFDGFTLFKKDDRPYVFDKDKAYIRKTVPLFIGLCVGMSLAWSVFCSYTDITKVTWHTKEMADAVEVLGLDNNNTYLRWDMSYIGDGLSPESFRDAHNYKHEFGITQFFDSLAYLDENIFVNHNMYNHDVTYNMQSLDSATNERIFKDLSELGYPEFFVGDYTGLGILETGEEMPSYLPVYRIEVYKPDKFIVDYNDLFIYAREDIYTKRNDWPIKAQLVGTYKK